MDAMLGFNARVMCLLTFSLLIKLNNGSSILVGCYLEADLTYTVERSVLQSAVDLLSMTVDICVEFCRTHNAENAFLRNGFVCRCGDISNGASGDLRCTMTCRGTSTDARPCGTSSTVSAYRLIYSTVQLSNLTSISTSTKSTQTTSNPRASSPTTLSGVDVGNGETTSQGVSLQDTTMSFTKISSAVPPDTISTIKEPRRDIIGVAIGTVLSFLVGVAVTLIIVFIFLRRRNGTNDIDHNQKPQLGQISLHHYNNVVSGPPNEREGTGNMETQNKYEALSFPVRDMNVYDALSRVTANTNNVVSGPPNEREGTGNTAAQNKYEALSFPGRDMNVYDALGRDTADTSSPSYSNTNPLKHKTKKTTNHIYVEVIEK